MEQSERKYWDMEIEPLLNTPRMREIQWEKLQEAIRYCYEKVPFDRKRMEKTGVRPEDIRSFDDFAYYELVDPETKEPVPMEHGATGLAVMSPLEPNTLERATKKTQLLEKRYETK